VFDLAILDMHMPQMSGVELARRLRAARPALPLVLFTSLGRKERHARVETHGREPVVSGPTGLHHPDRGARRVAGRC